MDEPMFDVFGSNFDSIEIGSPTSIPHVDIFKLANENNEEKKKTEVNRLIPRNYLKNKSPSKVEDILKYHSRKRPSLLPKTFPPYSYKKNKKRKNPSFSLEPSNVPKKRSKLHNSDEEDPKKKLKKKKKKKSGQTGRELKHEAQDVISNDPKLGATMFLQAGIIFMKEALSYEEKKRLSSAVKYYESNSSYFMQIAKLFGKYGSHVEGGLTFERGIALTCAALCSLKTYVMSTDEIMKMGMFIVNETSSTSSGANVNVRREICKYVGKANHIINVFGWLEESRAMIPKKFYPTPLHKNMYSTTTLEMIDYVLTCIESNQ